jgi:hypothetical protein
LCDLNPNVAEYNEQKQSERERDENGANATHAVFEEEKQVRAPAVVVP